MKLKLGDGLNIPIEMAGQAVALVGIRGSGKTNTGGVIAEELLDHGQQIVVIDPTDAWWGLRSKYPVFIFGGMHGDLELTENDGKTLAEFVVQERVPVILSLRHLRKGAQRRLITEFCEELYHLKGRTEYRTPLTVFIDEAPQFIPQRVIGEMARLVGAVQDMILLGRSVGFGVVMISQRFATLNADVRTQADTVIVHRLPSPLDRKALNEWIEENASIAEQKEVLSSLATLKTGEAWLWAPYFDLFKRQQIRARRTFDSSAAPKRGAAPAVPKDLTKIDIEKLKGKMASAIETAKANDPKELKRQIGELRKENERLSKTANVITSKTTAEKPVPALTDADRALIEKLADAIRLRLEDAGSQMRTLQARLQVAVTDAAHEYFNDNLDVARKAMADIEGVLEKPSVKKLLEKLNGLAVAPVPSLSKPVHIMRTERTQVPGPKLQARTPSAGGDSNGHLPPGEHATLTAALTYPDGLERKRLGVLTGYKRSSRDAYIVRLQAKGLVDTNGTCIYPTPEGRTALPDFEPLPTGQALVDYWRARLPEGERKTLDVLLDTSGDTARDIIDESTGYKRSSRDAYLIRLKARGLVEFVARGMVRASAELLDGR